MKSTVNFGFGKERCCLKKSVTLSFSVKCFFRPAISFPTGLAFNFRKAVAGKLVELVCSGLHKAPVTVFFSVRLLKMCGLRSFQRLSVNPAVPAGRIFSQFHYVR